MDPLGPFFENSVLNNKSGYSKGYLLLVILCLAFLGFLYGKILIHPNQYIFNSAGDGIKNYYTYAYYIAKNKSNTSFEGFNYPYEEVLIYTDCNPVLAFCIKKLAIVFPGITQYSIGILNFIMIFSFFLTSSFLYLIFKNLRIHPLLSALSALSIMVLAPQVFRLSGHYSLSYGFVIPLTILLLFKIQQNKKILTYATILFIHIFCSFFTHPYLGLISVSIIFTYVFVQWIFLFRSRSFYGFQTIILFLSAAFPLIIFYAFTSAMDTHLGRTTNPYGFFEYYADLDTIFLPNHPPLLVFVKKFLPSFTQTWEGWSYIGVVAIITGFIIVIRFIRFILKKQKLNNALLEFPHKTLIILFISSIILVFFSMGLPFRFLPKHYLDYFSFIKQFRSIGRFAWVFFFVINIVAILVVDRYGRRLFVSGKRGLVYVMFILTPSFIFFEGVSGHMDISNKIVQSNNPFLQKNLPDNLNKIITKVDANHYAAIIPLPYYNIGSENFTKEASNETYSNSFLLSYHSGIPLISNFTARASISESKNLMQLFSDGFYSKQIVNDFDSNLPFLILCTNGSLNLQESLLISKATPLYKDNDVALFKISREDLLAKTSGQEFQYFHSLKDELYPYNGLMTNDSNSYFFYNGYNDVVNENMINFRGNGVLSFMKNDRLVLADAPANKFAKNHLYIASFWIYNGGHNYGQDVLTNIDFNIYQSTNQKIIETIKPQSSMVINNDWSLVELPFSVSTDQGTIQFILEGKDWKNRKMYLDDVFIYRRGTTYYRVDKAENKQPVELFKNNHQIRK